MLRACKLAVATAGHSFLTRFVSTIVMLCRILMFVTSSTSTRFGNFHSVAVGGCRLAITKPWTQSSATGSLTALCPGIRDPRSVPLVTLPPGQRTGTCRVMAYAFATSKLARPAGIPSHHDFSAVILLSHIRASAMPNLARQPIENHQLELSFEAFNVTNTQRMGGILATRDGYALVDVPQTSAAPTNFSNFVSIQGNSRGMQCGF